MAVFCANPRAGVALAFSLGVGLGLGGALPVFPAAAAQPAPVTLAPPQSLVPSKPLKPPKPGPGSQTVPAAKPGVVEGDIKVGTLDEIDPNSVGLLDANGGGFGVAMWSGTPRALVERLLPRLSGALKSASARDLYRRLLLSAAATPIGPGIKNAPSLVSMRVDRLIAQGDLVSARSLLRVVSSRMAEEAIALDRARIALLMNDNAGVCAEVRARLDQNPSVFWRKGQVFCQLLAGDVAGASIGTGLLREEGVEDAPFYALARMLGGEAGIAVGGLEKPTPLHMAMMRAARVQVPSGVIGGATPAVLRTVAFSPNADLDTRLEAAELAEMRGALNTEALRQLYLSVNFTPDELSGALSAAGSLSGPRARALLFRAARNQNVAAAQAEIIARGLALARTQGRRGTAVRVFAPQLAMIEASEDLAWFAAEAGAALYYAGETAAAAKWRALAEAKSKAAAKPNVSAGPGASTDEAVKMPADAVLWPFAVLVSLPATKSDTASDTKSDTESATLKPTVKKLASSPGVEIAAAVEARPLKTLGAAAPGAMAPSVIAQDFDTAGFDRWWRAAAVLGEARRTVRAARILVLIEALGASVPDAAWSPLVGVRGGETVSLPPIGLMTGLKRAAAAGRVGETVLLALLAIGPKAPAAIDARILGPVVKALYAVGLTDAARGLAIEAVFGSSS